MHWRAALPEQTCALCGTSSPLIAAHLGVCGSCIRARPDQALPLAQAAHAAARREFGLPEETPQAEARPERRPEPVEGRSRRGGRRCGLCMRDCTIAEGQRGYCGLRVVWEGRIAHLAGTSQRGVLHWYRDPLPTNCVADWVCTGHRQWGKHNLAVFYQSCTLDCLFCQNWHYRQTDPVSARGISAVELAGAANERTYCVCYFGGDPASQMPHALAASRLLAERGVVVCWETAGTANPKLMDRALELSLESGGCVKFDLKAYDENLHRALTGGSNAQTLANFARAAARFDERPDPPPVVASTLLVPGYVDAEEVGRIARFIAAQNPAIPYALLGFGPHFYFSDLPRTSVNHAREAEETARAAGLTNVRVGNVHLLSRDY